jgi:small-conductance mechanosensitive channel
METQNIYHLVLVAHITGITMMAGATLTDYVIFNQFWKFYPSDKPRAMAIRDGMSKLPMLIGAGIILLILSGVGMMAITKGVFGEQVWFRIKFGLVLLVIVNGLAVGRRQGTKLRGLLVKQAEGEQTEEAIMKVKNNLRLFHMVQLFVFLIIFVLSVFKFN